MAIMGSSPYGQFGSGFGMGPGGGPMGMVGMAPGQSPPGGMMHHPGSGGGSSQDGPSWGQVAASSKAGPPPPPPQPATAVEEWPELGGGPGGAANTGLSRVNPDWHGFCLLSPIDDLGRESSSKCQWVLRFQLYDFYSAGSCYCVAEQLSQPRSCCCASPPGFPAVYASPFGF